MQSIYHISGKCEIYSLKVKTVKRNPIIQDFDKNVRGSLLNGLSNSPFTLHSTQLSLTSGALFVPGVVLDSADGARLLHGEVIETGAGPRLLPPDVKSFDSSQLADLCVQGFDLSAEEAR
jgi:hypothetical protein